MLVAKESKGTALVREQVAAAILFSDSFLECCEETVEPAGDLFRERKDLFRREPCGSDVHPGIVGWIVVVQCTGDFGLGMGGCHEGFNLEVTFKPRDRCISVV